MEFYWYTVSGCSSTGTHYTVSGWSSTGTQSVDVVLLVHSQWMNFYWYTVSGWSSTGTQSVDGVLLVHSQWMEFYWYTVSGCSSTDTHYNSVDEVLLCPFNSNAHSTRVLQCPFSSSALSKAMSHQCIIASNSSLKSACNWTGHRVGAVVQLSHHLDPCSLTP
ncbi:hypothetical protein Btru_015220 [Bulinus truncatus]|nr:hypothetical protein Btru_015220 [Bulinus truncatus]